MRGARPATAPCAPTPRTAAARLAPVAARAGLGGEPVVHVGHDDRRPSAPSSRSAACDCVRASLSRMRSGSAPSGRGRDSMPPGADQVRRQRLGQVAGAAPPATAAATGPSPPHGVRLASNEPAAAAPRDGSAATSPGCVAADQLREQPAVSRRPCSEKRSEAEPAFPGEPRRSIRTSQYVQPTSGSGIQHGGLAALVSFVGAQHVVGIEEDVAAAGQLQARVAGGARGRGSRLPVHGGAATRKLLEHGGRVVGRGRRRRR